MRKKLIELEDRLAKFVVGTEGNCSAKMKEGFIIKTSGASFSDHSHISCFSNGVSCPQDVLIKNEKLPSMESGFHSYIYNHSGSNFIAHTHPTNTLKILCSNLVDDFAKIRLFPDQVVFNGPCSCVVPYATPGHELAKVIKDYVSAFIEFYKFFPKLILLQNHGIIASGKSVNEVVAITEICEKSAEIFLGSWSLGQVDLKAKPVIDIMNDSKETYRLERIIE